jgi:hypothetical protein
MRSGEIFAGHSFMDCGTHLPKRDPCLSGNERDFTTFERLLVEFDLVIGEVYATVSPRWIDTILTGLLRERTSKHAVWRNVERF